MAKSFSLPFQKLVTSFKET